MDGTLTYGVPVLPMLGAFASAAAHVVLRCDVLSTLRTAGASWRHAAVLVVLRCIATWCTMLPRACRHVTTPLGGVDECYGEPPCGQALLGSLARGMCTALSPPTHTHGISTTPYRMGCTKLRSRMATPFNCAIDGGDAVRSTQVQQGRVHALEARARSASPVLAASVAEVLRVLCALYARRASKRAHNRPAPALRGV